MAKDRAIGRRVSSHGTNLRSNLRKTGRAMWERLCVVTLCVPIHRRREARTKALTSWRNSGTAASIVFAIEFLAFLHPPTPVGRSGLDTDSWNDEPGVESALRTYFWFSALGMTLGLFALLTATMMSMQLNMMAYEADVMWFFELYGNTLFGWPTTLLILSIICLAGTVVSSAFITYPLHSDAVAFLCLVCVGCVLSLSMFVTFSTRSWARINTTNARVWPVGDRTPPGSPRVTSGGSALYREQSRRAFGRQPSVGTIVTATSAHINGRSFTSSLEGGRSMSVRTAGPRLAPATPMIMGVAHARPSLHPCQRSLACGSLGRAAGSGVETWLHSGS